MTKDEIIQMAREAGFESHDAMINHRKELVRFYDLVVAYERQEFAKHALEIARGAVNEEREACAKVCEGLRLEWEDQPSIAQAERATMMDCANAIRARGNK